MSETEYCKSFDTWKCPTCGYIITDTEMQAFKFDYGCQRCGLSFSNFILQPAESHDNCDEDVRDV